MMLGLLDDRKNGVVAVCVLAVLQSMMRFLIAGSIVMGGIETWDTVMEATVSTVMMLALNGIFFLLGALGILFAAGLWMRRSWGIDGTMALSALTIAFDIWAMFTFQMSAAMGLVFPAVFIVYLLYVREDYLQEAIS